MCFAFVYVFEPITSILWKHLAWEHRRENMCDVRDLFNCRAKPAFMSFTYTSNHLANENRVWRQYVNVVYFIRNKAPDAVNYIINVAVNYIIEARRCSVLWADPWVPLVGARGPPWTTLPIHGEPSL